jgi:mannose/fructose/N-acetylgalactosamine-specific phosphotransferase system component IID
MAGCVIPIIIFANRFGLFERSGYEEATDSLGNVIVANPPAPAGWCILACILIGWTSIQIISEIRKANKGYSFVNQCLDGLAKTTIPLVAIIIACFFLKTALDDVTYCLIVVAVCRTIAIPLNPLPKWRYDKSGVEDYSDALSYIVKFVKSKAKAGDK